jgi:hypothetical protein
VPGWIAPTVSSARVEASRGSRLVRNGDAAAPGAPESCLSAGASVRRIAGVAEPVRTEVRTHESERERGHFGGPAGCRRPRSAECLLIRPPPANSVPGGAGARSLGWWRSRMQLSPGTGDQSVRTRS